MYAKVFNSMFEGSLRGRSDAILTFVNMLTSADSEGFVDRHFRSIADETGLPLERVKVAIAELESPDPDSRSAESDGRRIERISEQRSWGWRIVNYRKYRDIRDASSRSSAMYGVTIDSRPGAPYPGRPKTMGYVYYARNLSQIKIGFSTNPWARINELRTACPSIELLGLEKGTRDLERERQQQFAPYNIDREWFRQDKAILDFVATIGSVVDTTKVVLKRQGTTRTTSPQEEVKGEAEAEGEGKAISSPNGDSPAPPALVPSIEDIWNAYPYKVGKPDGMRAIQKALERGYEADFILARTMAYAKARNGDLTFVPNPSTWFNQERFNDDPTTWAPKNSNGHQPQKKEGGAAMTQAQRDRLPVTRI